MSLPDAGTVTDHGTVPPSWGRSVDDLIEYVGPLGVWTAGGFTPEPGAPATATGMVVTLLTVDEADLLPEGLDEDVSYYLSTESGLALFADPGLSEAIALPPDGPAIEVHYTWLDQWEAVQQFRRTQEPPQMLPPSVYVDATPLGVYVGAIAQAFEFPLSVEVPVPFGLSLAFARSGIAGTFSHGRAVMGVTTGFNRAAMSGVGIANVQRILGIQASGDRTARDADAIAALGNSVGFGNSSRTEQAPEEPPQLTIIPGAPVLEALLFNEGAIADSIDVRHLWLGLDEDATIVQPPAPPTPSPEAVTVTVPGADHLEALLFNAAPVGDGIEQPAFWLGLDGDTTITTTVSRGVRVSGTSSGSSAEAPPAAVPDGLSWIDADLWNTPAIATDFGPGGMALAFLGVESLPAAAAPELPQEPEVPQEPIDPTTPWLDALLFNEAAIASDLDARKVWLGVDGTTAVVPPAPPAPPEPEWVHWTEYDLFNEAPLTDLVAIAQFYLGVG